MIEFDKADPKGPRVRKNHTKMLTKEFFKALRKKHPYLKNYTDRQIRLVVKSVHAKMREIISETRDGLSLPNELGNIILGACKVDTPYSPELKRSAELGIVVHHKNWNSNGWICKVCYSSYAAKYRYKNSSLWAFEALKHLKKDVSRAFTKDHKKYIILDYFPRINYYFRIHSRALAEKKRNLRENE